MYRKNSEELVCSIFFCYEHLLKETVSRVHLASIFQGFMKIVFKVYIKQIRRKGYWTTILRNI